MRRKPARTSFALSMVTVSVSKSPYPDLIQIATKSNLEIMNQRKDRGGDSDWTGIDCVEATD